MNKLQLYIAKSLRGYKSLVNFNPTEDVRRHVRDLRAALATIEYDPLEKNIFYLVEYIAEGSLLSILRTIPTEPLDHLAATIFVPADSLVGADELDEVVREITRKMSAPGMSADDIAELRRLFARDYPDRAAGERGAMVESDPAGGYARCLYGGMSGRRLSDYFGPHLYQPDWTPFAGVLLLDADLGLGGTAADISEEPLRTTTPLLPPEHTKEGFIPHIYGRVFDRPFAVPLGADIDVRWTRPGFEDRVSTMHVGKQHMTAAGAVTSDARKTLTPASFMITSRTERTPLPDCTVTVNGIAIESEHTFTEAELAPAAVSVSCPGYAPYSGRINLAGSTVAHIRLDAPGRVYRFQMPVRSTEFGAPVSFEIRSKHAISQSPIEGYEALDTIREGAGRVNMLAFSRQAGGSVRRAVIAAAAGLVVGVLLGFCLFAGGSDERVGHRKEQPVAAADTVAAPADVKPAAPAAPAASVRDTAAARPAAPAVAAQTREQSVEAAVKYLDEHRSWNRNEMARYAALDGLFDDMNALRLDRIRDKWAKELKGSRNFSAVVRAAEGSQRKKINVHRDRRDTYNKPGDDAIGYVGYTYWIDP